MGYLESTCGIIVGDHGMESEAWLLLFAKFIFLDDGTEIQVDIKEELEKFMGDLNEMENEIPRITSFRIELKDDWARTYSQDSNRIFKVQNTEDSIHELLCDGLQYVRNEKIGFHRGICNSYIGFPSIDSDQHIDLHREDFNDLFYIAQQMELEPKFTIHPNCCS